MRELLDKISKCFGDGPMGDTLGPQNIRKQVEVALREDSVPVLFLVFREDVGEEEADEGVGPTLAALGYQEHYQLHHFRCLYWKYLVLKHQEDLVQNGRVSAQIFQIEQQF